MSIGGSFSNALSGLSATGRMAEIASNNLANALTKGYGRQSVVTGSRLIGAVGAGVQVIGLDRAAAPDLTAARRVADGDAATLGPQADALGRLGLALGEVDGIDGLFLRVENFETELRHLAETPESEARQIAASEAARDLTQFLNRLADTVRTERQNADARIADQVGTVNRNVQSIADLNTQITRLQASGRDTATLIDQRENLIDEVAAIIPVRVMPRDHGQVHLVTAQGQFLLSETPSQISFTRSPVITPAMSYDPSGGGLSGITLGGFDITPGSGTRQAIEGGALAGNFAVRDGIAKDLGDQLDQFAGDLVGRFQDPSLDTTLAAGDPGLFTDDGNALGSAADVEGLASRLSLNALVDPAQGGDPSLWRDGLGATAPGPASSDTLIRGILDRLTEPQSASAIPGLSGIFSVAQNAAGITELVGVQRISAERASAQATSLRESLAANEAATIGVNQDAELQSLLVIEQAYAANVQVIQTASQMLQELMEIR